MPAVCTLMSALSTQQVRFAAQSNISLPFFSSPIYACGIWWPSQAKYRNIIAWAWKQKTIGHRNKWEQPFPSLTGVRGLLDEAASGGYLAVVDSGQMLDTSRRSAAQLKVTMCF
jgi:hypothetical protein